MSVHVHAPPAITTFNVFDWHCRVPARDGRVCGSRRAFVRTYEWYGPTATCWFCGAQVTDGEYHGRAEPAWLNPEAATGETTCKATS